jgi:hypothetical protein
MATSNIGFQSFYQSQLTSAISNTDLTIPLDVLPTPNEGYLVIESTVSAQREIIYYTSKTGTAVVVPSGAGNGRGFDGTTAVSHTQSATVIMAPIGAMFGNQAIKDMLGVTADPTGSWNLLDGGAPTVSSVDANGNRSYTINFASNYSTTLSPGMRLKTTRTVAAPTQCTDLESGSSQYYSKSSPSSMAQTDDITCAAWIKLESYADGTIEARHNGSTGWYFDVNSSGQVALLGQATGTRQVRSYQSIPLNKWVHVAAFLDMSGNTYTSDSGATNNFIMIDGVVVPGQMVDTGGTPSALTPAGNYNVGARNGGTFWDGKLAQVAYFGARITPTTLRTYMSQGYAGTETNVVSAYSFNNSINDLAATANNLTAQGSAVATNADSPFGCQADGTVSSTLDYSIITKIATTAVTVQVPEGCTIPTTGGVAGVSYATVKVPYGFPGQRGKWQISSISLTNQAQLTPTSATWYNVGSHQLSVPVGSWTTTIEGNISSGESGGTLITANATLSKANNTQDNLLFTSSFTVNAGAGAAANVNIGGGYSNTVDVETSAIQVYYLNIMSTSLTPPTLDLNSANAIIQVTNAYL